MRVIRAYQRAFWYSAVAIAEAKKPLGVFNEVLLILTFLSVRGYHYTLIEAAVAYVGVLACSIVVGVVIVRFHFLRYNNTFSNAQNPELQEILERLRRIEARQADAWGSVSKDYTGSFREAR